MRNIKYILIHEEHPENNPRVPRFRLDRNRGYHYIVNRRSSECNPSSLGDCRVASEVGNTNSAGEVLNPIEIREPGHIFPGLSFTEKDFNAYSIGIQYNGLLSEDLQLSTFNSQTDSKLSAVARELDERTLNSQLATLIDLLVDLRLEFPSAKILGVCEIDGKNIKPNDEMNRLRLELSNEP